MEEERAAAAKPVRQLLRERFGLTRTESEIACALTEGLRYAEVAEQHCVSYHTVHSHVKAIHLKTGASSTARLMAMIRREGWTE